MVRVFVVLATCVLALLTSSASGSYLADVVDEATLKQTEDESNIEASLLNSPLTETDLMLLGVHESDLEVGEIAVEANKIADIARILDISSVEDAPLKIEELVDELCPAAPDCSLLPLEFRPINEICNNLEHPFFGNPDIAQRRLAKAFWEQGALINGRLQNPYRMIPVDTFGATLLPNHPFMFHLRGTGGFRLHVLNPSLECIKQTAAADSETIVDGIIETATFLEYSVAGFSCSEGLTFFIEGNTLFTTAKCAGTFRLCFQPIHITIDMPANAGETCSMTIDGEVQDDFNNDDDLFSEDEIMPFFMDLDDDQTVSVGAGNPNGAFQVIMKGKTPFINLIAQLNKFKHKIAVSVLKSIKPNVFAQFPVEKTLILESNAGNTRSLEDAPHVFDDSTLTFGINNVDFTKNAYRIDMFDDPHEVQISMLLFPGRSRVLYRVGGVRKGGVAIDDALVTNIPYLNAHDDKIPNFNAYWLTVMKNKVYAGVGNVVGEHEIAPLLLLSIGVKFEATRVEVRSFYRTRWAFNLVQFGTPRQTGVNGLPLPSPRDVSLAMHTNIDQPVIFSDFLTMGVMQMGQFVDHDGIFTPVEESENPRGAIPCCSAGVPATPLSRFCLNIPVTEATDPQGSQGSFPSDQFDCIGLTRSSPTIECNFEDPLADLRSREPLNGITAFVDGSNIYGSKIEQSGELREGPNHGGARLLTTRGSNELPVTAEAGEAECNNEDNPEFLCALAGDVRVAEQPGLTGIHALFVREHNRVVNNITTIFDFPENTDEERELLYQEARRIVVAEYQNIVYNGYLRSFLDEEIFNQFDLGLGQCSYEPDINPGTFNEWGIANRIGHTWINPNLIGSTTPLVDHFFNPVIVNTLGSDPLIMNFYEQLCPNTDRTIETAVTEDLFRDGDDALDLASLNIQRGRDHGVSYCRTRAALNLVVPYSFAHAQAINLFPASTIDLLSSVYSNICDLDLFTAVVSETPLLASKPGSTSPIGETLNHIQATFFRRSKCGDRYWFEFADAGFTPEQIDAISDVTFSTVICDNGLGIGRITQDSFHVESSTNLNVTCNEIPRLDLNLFEDINPNHKRRRQENLQHPAVKAYRGFSDSETPNTGDWTTPDEKAARAFDSEAEVERLLALLEDFDKN